MRKRLYYFGGWKRRFDWWGPDPAKKKRRRRELTEEAGKPKRGVEEKQGRPFFGLIIGLKHEVLLLHGW